MSFSLNQNGEKYNFQSDIRDSSMCLLCKKKTKDDQFRLYSIEEYLLYDYKVQRLYTYAMNLRMMNAMPLI